MADTGFDRPTLRESVDRVAGDMNTRLPGLDARLRRSKANVIARIVAGVVHTLYGYVAAVAREILVSTASAVGLPLHGAIWGVPRRDAQASTGLWTFTGTPAASVPLGTAFVMEDGTEWLTTAADVIGGGGTVNIACEAQTAGIIGNVVTSTTGTLTATVTGVSSAVVAAEDITNGLDVEDIEAWRARILARIQDPPQGGALTDYEQWTLQVSGVDRVWVTPNGLGPGTVVIRFTIPGTGAAVIPGAPKVAEVQAWIDALAPVTADVTVAAPVAYVQDFTIYLDPNGDGDVEAAVEAELEALFAESADPEGGIIRSSHIREAISRADGEEYHTLTIPAGDVQAPVGELPIVGTITWS